MSTSNPIMDILDAAQDGQLLATVAAAAEIDDGQAREAIEVLSRDIARQIAKLTSDSDRFEDLLDVLDDDDHDEYLDDPGEILKRDAIEDGEDILEATYGSLDAAHRAARKLERPDGLTSQKFERLMSLAATLTLSAMSRQNRLLQFGVADVEGEYPGGRGFIATMISAIVTGFLEGFKQAITRKRPRRKRDTLSDIFDSSRSKRKTRTKSRKRRSKTPSLKDLLGDLLKG